MSDAEEDGLLNIHLTDDEDTPAEKKAKRTRQSGSEFEAVQRAYVVRVENGDMYKNVKLPLPSGASKVDVQDLLHAVEELYFFRRYREAAELATRALQEESRPVLDEDALRRLERYEAKCRAKDEPLAVHSAEQRRDVGIQAGPI